MNEILQKRIEEASIEYTMRTRPMCIAGGAFADMARELNKNPDFIVGATFALQNQWISVEEALPDMIDEDMEWSDIVLIKCKYCEDMKPCIMTSRYDVGTGFWLNPVAREITHWMPIPSLKGGEQ